tara:strand:- start:322 stop:690 length:369 start_codon:yes stop_codon:yes gene_type:complete
LEKIKMLKILIIKISFVLIIFFITSCSYLTPKSVNEYSVTRKSPLVIPPDMNMTPPGKKTKKKLYKQKKLSNEDKDFNLDEILIGETNNNRTMSKKNKKARNKKKLDLVKTILKMKEITTLK